MQAPVEIVIWLWRAVDGRRRAAPAPVESGCDAMEVSREQGCSSHVVCRNESCHPTFETDRESTVRRHAVAECLEERLMPIRYPAERMIDSAPHRVLAGGVLLGRNPPAVAPAPAAGTRGTPAP